MSLMTDERYEQITRTLAMISVKDLRPISICSGEGFHKYSRALSPIYVETEYMSGKRTI